MSTQVTITATSATQNARSFGFPFVSLGLFGFLFIGRRAHRALNVSAFITVLAFTLLLAACGGYGKQNSNVKPNSTPAASNVALTATGGSISHTTTINVVVR
jgi:hypothetical protein